MLAANPPVAKIYQSDQPPITVFRRDYWPNGTVPTAAQFRRQILRHARRISMRLNRPVFRRVVHDQFALILIATDAVPAFPAPVSRIS